MKRPMILVRVLALLTLVLPAPAPAIAQAPPGHRLGQHVPLPDSVREVLAGGRYQVTIRRQVTDSFQRRLLELAERILPDTGAINEAAAKESLSQVSARLAAAAKRGAERWWWEELDGTLTPFAVTGAAVGYYRNRIHDHASATGTAHTAELIYTATVYRVEPSEAGRASYVVRMRLSWDSACGPLCGMSFIATRAVYFNADGNVLRVEGDRKPLVVVS